MWSSTTGGGLSTGYRDPTVPFAENATTTSSASTWFEESYVDYRTLQGLIEAAPGMQAAHNTRGRRGADPLAKAAWAQRQRERQERRFFRKRGAVDYQRNAVFLSAGCEPGEEPHRDGVQSSADEENLTCAHPQRQQRGQASKSAFDDEPAGDCVPEELQLWYVASSSAVHRVPIAATAARASKSAKGAEQPKARHSTTHAASAKLDEMRAGEERLASAGTFTGCFSATDVPGGVAARSSIRSAGAGTTSVNVLQSRVAPRSGYVVQLPDKGEAHAAEEGRAGQAPISAGAAQAAAPPTSGSVRKDSAGNSAESHAWGGRPPLRAHRYVEQPNGIFLDHAQHADLLAKFAVEAEIRHAQEKGDARRARRWTRHLYGQWGEETRPGGRLRQDGTTAATASANTSAAALARGRYCWFYDAATYRHRFVSTLRYLQRVHVFLVAVAAGVSLLMLSALTVPLPLPSVSGGASAVLLLALFENASVTPTGTGAVAAGAHVLPVMEQGSPTFALVLAVTQVYHTSLLLCLCLLLVITGYAPVPWSVAEWYWMAQRRRWLQEEHRDAERAGDWGSQAGMRKGSNSGGSGRSISAASNSDIAFAKGSSAAGLRDQQGASSMARQDAMSSSNVLGSGGGGSRSALFASMYSHHSPDDRRSRSVDGDGDWAKREAHASDELTCGATHAHQQYREDFFWYADSAFAGLKDSVMCSVGQHARPSAASLLSPRGRDGVAACYHPLHHNSASGSLAGSSATAALGHQQQPYRPQGGAFTLRGARSAAALSAAPFRAPAIAAAQRVGGASADRALQPLPPVGLSPAGALEGGLSAGNVFTRTFDHVERCAMQQVCNALHTLAHACCMLCAQPSDDTIASSGAGNALGGAARETAVSPRFVGGGTSAAGRELGFSLSPEIRRASSVAPAPLYLHVLFQPRLWCVAVALALTIVEIAFIDERTIELLWLAQPASWWSASATPPERTTSTGDVILPHVWTVANFTPVSARRSSGGVRIAAAASGVSALPDDAECTSGHVWRVLMAVYATRMAVLWIAFILNVFL
ncbi:hypothetical protein LSCM1_08119 [Leishmania martiniquensis]|uniref:Uncharacterized protein n=1 Tax=Leishmania martiniquensis TaxID=1580590 RepID=A0A836I4D3_9TRYP|nr:hypothetical protein LSCM1_08119 [Leishmania martiniquensis]